MSLNSAKVELTAESRDVERSIQDIANLMQRANKTAEMGTRATRSEVVQLRNELSKQARLLDQINSKTSSTGRSTQEWIRHSEGVKKQIEDIKAKMVIVREEMEFTSKLNLNRLFSKALAEAKELQNELIKLEGQLRRGPAQMKSLNVISPEEGRASERTREIITNMRDMSRAQRIAVARTQEVKLALREYRTEGRITGDTLKGLTEQQRRFVDATIRANPSLQGMTATMRKLNPAIFQLSSAAQDFAIVLQGGGGLARASMAVSNNLGALAATMGGWTAIVGTAAVIAMPPLVAMMEKFLFGTDAASDAVDRQIPKLKDLRVEYGEVRKAIEDLISSNARYKEALRTDEKRDSESQVRKIKGELIRRQANVVVRNLEKAEFDRLVDNDPANRSLMFEYKHAIRTRDRLKKEIAADPSIPELTPQNMNDLAFLFPKVHELREAERAIRRGDDLNKKLRAEAAVKAQEIFEGARSGNEEAQDRALGLLPDKGMAIDQEARRQFLKQRQQEDAVAAKKQREQRERDAAASRSRMNRFMNDLTGLAGTGTAGKQLGAMAAAGSIAGSMGGLGFDLSLSMSAMDRARQIREQIDPLQAQMDRVNQARQNLGIRRQMAQDAMTEGGRRMSMSDRAMLGNVEAVSRELNQAAINLKNAIDQITGNLDPASALPTREVNPNINKELKRLNDWLDKQANNRRPVGGNPGGGP